MGVHPPPGWTSTQTIPELLITFCLQADRVTPRGTSPFQCCFSREGVGNYCDEIKTLNLITHACRSRCGSIGAFCHEDLQERYKSQYEAWLIDGWIHIDCKTPYPYFPFKKLGRRMVRTVNVITVQLFIKKVVNRLFETKR